MASKTGPFTTAPGPRRPWSYYTIWAEDGLIFLENTEWTPADRAEEQLKVMTCAEAGQRLRDWALEQLELEDKARTAAVDPAEKAFKNDAYYKMKQMLEVVTETIREARDQGDQSDPEVAAKKQRDFLRSKTAGGGVLGAMRSTGGLPSVTQHLERAFINRKLRGQ